MSDLAHADQSLRSVLDAAAAKQPAPGGGAVAAIAAALAAAMGSMVLNYSINKKDLAAHRPQLEAALKSFEQSRELLLLLMVQDQEAFLELSAARKVQAQDPQRFALALRMAISTPQGIGAIAVTLLSLVDSLADKVNPFLISDLSVCADLAMAVVRCAITNVQANLPDVHDAAEREKLIGENERMRAHGLKFIRQASSRIAEKMGQTP